MRSESHTCSLELVDATNTVNMFKPYQATGPRHWKAALFVIVDPAG